MNIGVVGSGQVGSALATGFADMGHAVMIGSREPGRAQLAEWSSADQAHRSIGDYAAATRFGEMVIIAVPGRLIAKTLDAIGRNEFDGKLVLDVTNPFAHNDQGELYDFYGDDDSGSELLQRELPRARVVKAFNQIGAAMMMHPEESTIQVLRMVGDDEDAKRRVRELGESIGWTVRDLGELRKARQLERGAVKASGGV